MLPSLNWLIWLKAYNSLISSLESRDYPRTGGKVGRIKSTQSKWTETRRGGSPEENGVLLMEEEKIDAERKNSNIFYKQWTNKSGSLLVNIKQSLVKVDGAFVTVVKC